MSLAWWFVPHTHWDREWYLPFQDFRWRLVRSIDEILRTLRDDDGFGGEIVTVEFGGNP